MNRKRFMRDEVFTLTLMATVRRAGVYKPIANEWAREKARNAFRLKLRKELDRITQAYSHRVSENLHIKNIDRLSKALSSGTEASALEGKRFRIGSAQKALNLYLKYLWCLGELKVPPPHCPFDFVILRCLQECASARWTQIDDLAEYKRWVAAAKKAARGKTLARWELGLYNEKAGSLL